ncbi:MAG TPA: hypothetical protein VLH86_05020 [Patescibacteria group bacterium]|nr:hypothetical protein [Patescibacteria group bacterium]
MSNDTKFWAFRILNFVLFTIDGWFLTNALMGVLDTNKGHSNHTAVWFVLTGLGLATNVPAYIYYRKAKAERWGSSPKKTQAELDVEILAAYGAQQQAEQEAAAHKLPTAPTPPTPPPSAPPTPPVPPAPPIPPTPTA